MRRPYASHTSSNSSFGGSTVAYAMSPASTARSYGFAAWSFSICAAVAKPSGITVPMSALTMTRERTPAPGAGAARKDARGDARPHASAVYAYGAPGTRPVRRAV